MAFQSVQYIRTCCHPMTRQKIGKIIKIFNVSLKLNLRRMSCVSRGADGHAFMTGVFDGHAGPHCAQAIAERLFYYTYFANCSNDEIKTMLDKYHTKRPLPLFGIRYFLLISTFDIDI